MSARAPVCVRKRERERRKKVREIVCVCVCGCECACVRVCVRTRTCLCVRARQDLIRGLGGSPSEDKRKYTGARLQRSLASERHIMPRFASRTLPRFARICLLQHRLRGELFFFHVTFFCMSCPVLHLGHTRDSRTYTFSRTYTSSSTASGVSLVFFNVIFVCHII